MITNQTINQAIDYILEHITDELSVDDVAAQCHFSKYYFSRMFKEETGESVYAFIKRLKLEQSAFRLKVEPDRAVTDIGYDFGYSPSNYSWMFRKQYQTNPVDFRRKSYERALQHPFYHATRGHMETFEECDRKIVIKNLPDYNVIYERRIGNYRSLSEQWNEFIKKYQDYVTDKTLFFERTFDDPSITDTDGCLYDICMSVDRDCALENTCTIEGGRCAVYSYIGSARHIYAAYQTIFTVWLPQTHYRLDNRSGFDIYRKVDSSTDYMELDICMPIV